MKFEATREEMIAPRPVIPGREENRRALRHIWMYESTGREVKDRTVFIDARLNQTTLVWIGICRAGR